MEWRIDAEGEHPALRVMVTAGELARGYAAFAADERRAARLLRRWMRDVPTEQTFGARLASETVGVPEGSVGVKCGWFGLERAHAVVLVELPGRTLGAAVTTVHPVDAKRQALVRKLSDDVTGLALAHDAIAGDLVRSATRRALELAAEL